MESDSSLELLVQQIRQAANKDNATPSDNKEEFKAHGKHQGVDPIWDKLMTKLSKDS